MSLVLVGVGTCVFMIMSHSYISFKVFSNSRFLDLCPQIHGHILKNKHPIWQGECRPLFSSACFVLYIYKIVKQNKSHTKTYQIISLWYDLICCRMWIYCFTHLPMYNTTQALEKKKAGLCRHHVQRLLLCVKTTITQKKTDQIISYQTSCVIVL